MGPETFDTMSRKDAMALSLLFWRIHKVSFIPCQSTAMVYYQEAMEDRGLITITPESMRQWKRKTIRNWTTMGQWRYFYFCDDRNYWLLDPFVNSREPISNYMGQWRMT